MIVCVIDIDDMAVLEPKGDNSRVRQGNAAENLSVLRRMALNMLKQETTSQGGVAAKRKRAGWDEDYLLLVLAN